MEKEEILEEIKRIKSQSFLLDMKDMWNSGDFARSAEYHRRIKELQEEFREKYGDEEFEKYLGNGVKL